MESGQYQEASELLLEYFRKRNQKHPRVNSSDRSSYLGKKLNAWTLKTAENGMRHYVIGQHSHPPFFGGKVINWFKLPYAGYENKVQIHRMYWWIPMGKYYWSTGREEVAEEWIDQYLSWHKAAPFGKPYAWRTLETSRRLMDLTDMFVYFVNSKHFTADFLVTFLNDIFIHAEHVYKHGASGGNWLLMESERSVTAAGFFHEFKDSDKWFKRAIDRIIPELKRQVYPDGQQRELVSSYHCGTIFNFRNTRNKAAFFGKKFQFPPYFDQVLKNMAYAKMKWTFPDWNVVRFGDAWSTSRGGTIGFFSAISKWYPEDPYLKYFATNTKQGKKPPFDSVEMPYSGFYILRSGWDKDDTCMVIKCGPDGGGHDSYDDNTFELYIKGRYFFPDTGCYTYGGDKKLNKIRNWMKSTPMHNTVSLNGRNNPRGGGIKKLFKTGKDIEIAVTEKNSWTSYRHRRSVFFVDKKYFLIVDQMLGKGKGTAALHYQLHEDWKPIIEPEDTELSSNFSDGNNIKLKMWSSKPAKLMRTHSVIAYTYNKKTPRFGIKYSCTKENNDDITFASIIYPFNKKAPNLEIKSIKANSKGINAVISINGKDRKLGYKLP